MIKLIQFLSLISVLIFSLPNQTFAEQSQDCSFKETSESIVNYIKDDRKILSNVLNNLSGGNDTSTIKGKLSDNLGKTRAKLIGLSNSLFNWNGYESYFRFYVLLPLSPIEQEIPYEILRDHKLIQNEAKMLDNVLQKMIKNNTETSEVDNPCDGVEYEKDRCEALLGKSSNASRIITKLIENNRNIADLYRKSILAKGESEDDNTLIPAIKKNIFLIDIKVFQSDYNETIISNYSKECGTWKRFQDKMDEIVDWQKVTKVGMVAWDDALMKLRCSGGESNVCESKDFAKYKETEKKLLKNELSRQGLSSNMTKKMLSNLESFNNNCKSNDIMDSVICGAKQSAIQTAKSVYNWDAQKGEDGGFVQNFLNASAGIIENGLSSKPATIQGISDENLKSQENSDINTKIATLYNNGIITIGQKASEEDKLQSRIIDIHMNLIKAIEELDDTYKNSKKVCESQASGQGNCEIN